MDIQEAIRDQIQTREFMGIPCVIERFLLRNGREYQPVAWQWKPKPMKECFRNATLIALHRKRPIFDYVEGLAFRPGLPLLFPHAWNAEAVPDASEAYDSTWRNNGDCKYFGVRMSAVEANRVAIKRRYYGVLQGVTGPNFEWMIERDPKTLDDIRDAQALGNRFAESLMRELTNGERLI